MVQQGFSTYARIRPCTSTRSDDDDGFTASDCRISYEILGPSKESPLPRLLFPEVLEDLEDTENNENSVSSPTNSILSNESISTADACEFQFSHIFDEATTQQDIFEVVCKDVVLGTLNGFNGSIFAYGQTASGKTYTCTGGNTYKERGIVPRVISMLFDHFDKLCNETEYSCYVSYLQIYNEAVYDLLDRSHVDKSIEEWNKVRLLEDTRGNVHFQNLGVYDAATEEDALRLLFLGNVHRVTSETSFNQASSRSHAIYSLLVEGRDISGTNEKTSSKLHLVDLAGSERVYNTSSTDRVKREGKHINLSLHYLEQVIRALQKETKTTSVKSSSHVPYRNSVLTSVLRGSLGGNCKSVFIATLNPEFKHRAETISTCRFMQRCSQIAVEVVANKEIDVKIKLRQVTAENEKLRAQMAQQAIEFKAQLEAAGAPSLELEDNVVPRSQDLVERLIADDESSFDEIKGSGMSVAMTCIDLLKSAFMHELDTRDHYQREASALSQQLLQVENQLQSREEEIQEIQTEKSNNSYVKNYIQKLKTGGVFIKHGRYGKPHARFVWCSSDLRYVQYRELGKTQAKVSIPSASVTKVVVGPESTVFKRNKCGKCCFSLLYDNRTLDLEVDEGDSSENKMQNRDEWINAFEFLIKLQDAQSAELTKVLIK